MFTLELSLCPTCLIHACDFVHIVPAVCGIFVIPNINQMISILLEFTKHHLFSCTCVCVWCMFVFT